MNTQEKYDLDLPKKHPRLFISKGQREKQKQYNKDYFLAMAEFLKIDPMKAGDTVVCSIDAPWFYPIKYNWT